MAELKEIAAAIREHAPVEMIILFGSHARGDWVEDITEEDGITYEYRSDYDILCVTATESAAKSNMTWTRVEKEFQRRHLSKTWISLIAHSIDEVNRKIVKGHFFFTDIKKEGVWLYNSRTFQLARIRKPHPNDRYARAKSDFEHWFDCASTFLRYSFTAIANDDRNYAAFNLHQAAEHLYHTLLLVHTGYKPKQHDLEKLGHQAGGFDAELLKVFPRTTKEEDRLFRLLKRAYIEARYHKGFAVTREELDYLGDRVRLLQQLTETVCQAKVAELKDATK